MTRLSTEAQKPRARVFRRLVRVLFACFALASCAPSVIPGDTVRVAIEGDVPSLNPVLAFTYQANALSEAMFDGLVKIDAQGAPVPDLAVKVPTLANGGISPDGRTIIYHLRRGVRWQDGARFTSSDVAFTYSLLRNPRINGANRLPYRNVVSLSTPDAHTVIVRLRAPSAVAVRDLFCVGNDGAIVPRHLLAASRDVNTDRFGRHPVGTGPYEFVSWEHGTRIVLRANRDYFAGVPHIRRLEIVELPSDATMANELQTQAVDIGEVEPAMLPLLRGDRHLRILVTPSYGATYVAFNLAAPSLRDRRVRRSLAEAIDRARLARLSSNGTARAAITLIPPFAFAFDPSGAARYHPLRAARLIAGRVPRALDVLESGDERSRVIALMLARAWRRLGIRTDIRAMAPNLLYAARGPLMRGTFEVAVLEQGFDADPDRSSFIVSSEAPPKGRNYARLTDPVVDRWAKEALRTNDTSERARLYALIQRRVSRDVPFVPIAWSSEIDVVNRRIAGYVPEPINSQFWNVAQWRIVPGRVVPPPDRGTVLVRRR